MSWRVRGYLCSPWFVGVYPIDADLDLRGLAKREAGLRIGAANHELIRSCEIVVANITPFRGPSADAGTVWEMGFAAGLGLRVCAYSSDPMPLTERTRKYLGTSSDAERDVDGMIIEDFHLADNLMLESSILNTGGYLVVAEGRVASQYEDLTTFERCISRLSSP